MKELNFKLAFTECNKTTRLLILSKFLMMLNLLHIYSFKEFSNDKTPKNYFKSEKLFLHYLQANNAIVTNNNTTSFPATSTTSLSIDTFTLVIAIVGSVVFIAICIVIVVCFCKKKQVEEEEPEVEKNKNQENEKSEKKEKNNDIKLNTRSDEIDSNGKENKKERENYQINKSNNLRGSNNQQIMKNNHHIQVDESDIRVNIDKYVVDKSSSGRRFLDQSDRENQKSFDLEEQFKNNLDNLDEKDEKLNEFLAENKANIGKKLSEMEIRKYQADLLRKEKLNNSDNMMHDLVSNFTENRNNFYSDDSRIQNSVIESIEYNYFDHMRDHEDNLSKLNSKLKGNEVKNISKLTDKSLNTDNLKKPNSINGPDIKYNQLPKSAEISGDNKSPLGFQEHLNNKTYAAERDLDNYNSNFQNNINNKIDKNSNKVLDIGRTNNDKYNESSNDEDYEADEYEEEGEYSDEYEEDTNKSPEFNQKINFKKKDVSEYNNKKTEHLNGRNFGDNKNHSNNFIQRK